MRDKRFSLDNAEFLQKDIHLALQNIANCTDI